MITEGVLNLRHDASKGFAGTRTGYGNMVVAKLVRELVFDLEVARVIRGGESHVDFAAIGSAQVEFELRDREVRG